MTYPCQTVFGLACKKLHWDTISWLIKLESAHILWAKLWGNGCSCIACGFSNLYNSLKGHLVIFNKLQLHLLLDPHLPFFPLASVVFDKPAVICVIVHL